MRRLISAAVLALAIVFASIAGAATLASRYTDLSLELQGRTAALPATGLSKVQKKQKSALKKSVAAINHDTTLLQKTLADVGTAVGALDPAYPSDATLGPLLDTMVVDQRTAVFDRNTRVFDRAVGIAAGDKTKTKVDALFLKAEALLVASDAATTRALRVKSIKAALKSVAKAEKALDKVLGPGGGDVTTTAYDVNIDGAAFHLPTTGITNYSVIYASGGVGSLNIVAMGPIGAVQHNIVISIASPGVGDRAMAPNSSYSKVPGTGPMQVTAGTVHISAFNPASHKVAGTFSGTFSDGITTVTLTNGTFSSTSMLP